MLIPTKKTPQKYGKRTLSSALQQRNGHGWRPLFCSDPQDFGNDRGIFLVISLDRLLFRLSNGVFKTGLGVLLDF